jgi:hypothetical protein
MKKSTEEEWGPSARLVRQTCPFMATLLSIETGTCTVNSEGNLDVATGSDLQLLRHEVMLVPGRMILEHSENAVSELFIERSCLKTEGIKKLTAIVDGFDIPALG